MPQAAPERQAVYAVSAARGTLRVSEPSELARLQHDALTWKAEAARLNTLIHEQRKEIERVRRESLAPIVRGLLRVVAELRPFLSRAPQDVRIDALRADLKNVEDLANTTLRRMGL